MFGHSDSRCKKKIKVQQEWVVKKQIEPIMLEKVVGANEVKDQSVCSSSYIEVNGRSMKEVRNATMLQTEQDHSVDKIVGRHCINRVAMDVQRVATNSSQKIDDLGVQMQGGEGSSRSNNQSVKKRGSKIIKDKSTIQVNNMFAALIKKNNLNEDNLEVRSKGLGKVKHILNQIDRLLLEGLNDPIRKSGKPKRNIHKHVRYK